MNALARLLLALLFVAYFVAVTRRQGRAWLRSKFLGEAGPRGYRGRTPAPAVRPR